ncbi:Hypothetical protein ERWE_CDS_01940 [Ehrlichia ruminantium str. Welgevonden]|uniref:Uncharacterized protein n=1 Tax=Ehrlichia ruminantium (strain Welgevonden) TaxID=254945 RepID=A0A0H3LZ96_EHRRW|nr:Hypothetical protein ERWE_CDS_01940 [Ehrlichia ruminantium str. Welgevonden]
MIICILSLNNFITKKCNKLCCSILFTVYNNLLFIVITNNKYNSTLQTTTTDYINSFQITYKYTMNTQ